MNRIKIAIVANCQRGPLASLLGLSSERVEIVPLPPIHKMNTDASRQEAADVIAAADIIVSQPIGEKFGPMGTESLKQRHHNKTFLSFPSIFFGGLSPQLFYLRTPRGTLQGPLGDYHDLRIVDAYLNGKSSQEAADAIENDPADYTENYREAAQDSARREADLDVKVMPTIQEIAAQRQSMHTMNHPCNEVLWHVTTSVMNLLSIPLSQGARPPMREYLGTMRAPVPPSITAWLGATWQSPNYTIDGEPVPASELVEGFYKVYDAEPNFGTLVSSNFHRFGRFARDIGRG